MSSGEVSVIVNMWLQMAGFALGALVGSWTTEWAMRKERELRRKESDDATKKEYPEWRTFVNSLTEKQRHAMLMELLEHQIESLGSDGDVCFREADEDGPADIYWSSCGDSLIRESDDAE